MSSVGFYKHTSSIIRCLLSAELEKLIPNLDLKGKDKIVLELAYNDLEQYFYFKNKKNYLSLDEPKIIEYRKDEIIELKAFIKYWSGLWVEKWKKRIAISQRIPKIDRHKVCKLRRARAFYHLSKDKKELKENIIDRLIKRGEICMPSQIAEELIIREIAENLKNRKFSVDENVLNILHGVFRRIEELQNETRPIIYLKLIKKPLGYNLR